MYATTNTRFTAAIIIALPIEALLIIFKSALQNSGQFIGAAVWVVIVAAFIWGLCVSRQSGRRMLSSQKQQLRN